MKKLMLVVVLLLAVGLWAQPEAPSAALTDVAHVQLNIKMVGIQFMIMVEHPVEIGANHTAGTFGGTAAGSYIEVGSIGDGTACKTVLPCEVANLVFGIENTGGITIDLEAGPLVYGAPFITWSWDEVAWAGAPGAYFCTSTEDRYKLAVGRTIVTLGSAGVWGAAVPLTWRDLAAGASYITFHDEGLLAEDPANLGDGYANWSAGETDVIDLFVGFVAPSSNSSESAAENCHTMDIPFTASVHP